MSRDKPYAGVICRGGHGEGVPACGKVGLTQREYDRQMNRPNRGWHCPRCGGLADFDDERFEELQGIAQEPPTLTQGGGEVGKVEQSHPMMGSGFMHAFTCKERLLEGTKVYTAPPRPEASDLSRSLKLAAAEEQAEAWQAVCALLSELRPGWAVGPGAGLALALDAIRTLAPQPAPSAPVGVDRATLRQALHAMKRCQRESGGSRWVPWIAKVEAALDAGDDRG